MTQNWLARSSPTAVGGVKVKVLQRAQGDRGKTGGEHGAEMRECGGSGGKAFGEVLGTVYSPSLGPVALQEALSWAFALGLCLLPCQSR